MTAARCHYQQSPQKKVQMNVKNLLDQLMLLQEMWV